jgi:hypothetical protein
MTTLSRASNEWFKRPDDQRFTSLPDMAKFMDGIRSRSHAEVLPNSKLEAYPIGDDHKQLGIAVNGNETTPTNWAFGQLCARVGAPAGYLKTLPTEVVADNLNYGLMVAHRTDETNALRTAHGMDGELRAVTGPTYGRIWNVDVVEALIDRFGDGVTGDWRVPGEFGRAVVVDKQNTTLYASDRDMFVFLADEDHRITVKDRRDGQPGTLARGFFLWNSEVGSATLGVGQFLFDYACKNRTVWGAAEYTETRLRHTSGAPQRWLDEAKPLLLAYANSSAGPLEAKIAAAQKAKVDNIEEFLTKRFTKGKAKLFMGTHDAEEGRPIESLWDASTAITAYARGIPHQDERVALEREAGKLLDLAA